jgi:hypothetical protein
MLRTLLILGLCLLSLPAQAREIPLQARVANTEQGVCYWACVETLGRAYGIAPLHGLTKRVLAEGIGRDDGATESSVEHWFQTLGVVKHRTTSKHSGTLSAPIHQGLHSIASLANWFDDKRNETHAVIVTGFADKQQFTDHRGIRRNDNVIKVIDPNHPERETLIAWRWFWDHWTGTVTWIDPQDQQQNKLIQSDRLLLATLDTPAPKTGMPAYQFPVQSLHPIRVAQPINVVTNDLKDGIHRPYDTMYDASYRLGHSHNYYIQSSP